MQHYRTLVAVATLALSLGVQISQAQIIPFDSNDWTIQAASHQLVNYDGQESLYLKGGEALLNVEPFMNGTVEFDIAFSAKRGFMGLRWRRQENGDSEEFYFRPHQSGQPDASQYTPRTNGLTTWQLSYGPSFAAPIIYRHNQWMHVKVVFSGSRGELYLDSDEPTLAFDLQRKPEAGVIAVWSNGLAPAYFANFKYENNDDVQLYGMPEPLPDAASGSVMSWQVSDEFDEVALADMSGLTKQFKKERTWRPLWSNKSGITNLAEVAKIGEGSNTVFARFVVEAERDVVSRVRFGYSDRVHVYFDDRLVYSGDNTYVTRDYRYLGTIGLFDAVHLEFKRGRNEVWFAISESFGGWGVMATVEEMDGLTVVPAEH